MWWAGFVLLVAIIAAMARNKLYRDFSFMFAYTLVVCASEIIRHIFISRGPIEYFYIYWIGEALTVAISFAVLYEVYLVRLFPTFYNTPIYRYLFPIAGLVIAGLTVLVFVSLPSHGPATLASIVTGASLVLSFFQVAAFVFFFAVAVILGGGWREHEFGIVLGFALHATAKLLTAFLRVQANYAHTRLDQLPVYSYLAALIIWLIFLSRKRTRIQTNIGPELLSHLHGWGFFLRRVLRKRS